MQRRKFLQSSAAALATAGAAPAIISRSWAQSELVIGGTMSLSGAFAEVGKFEEMGAKLAIDEKGTVAGKPIRYQSIDTEGNPGRAVRRVKEAIQQDGIRHFVGATLSSTGLAIGKEVNKAGGIYTTTVGADEVTGAECNKATFRWSVPTYGAIQDTLRPVIERHPDAKRWYTMTPQYVFGESLLRNAKNVFDEKGIEHVGNSYHSLDESEFSGYLTNAMGQSPDVLLLLNFGSQSTKALRQAINYGLNRNTIIVLAWSAGLEQYQSLGPENLEGVYLGVQYWHQDDAPANRKLVEMVNDRHGINPGYPLGGNYQATRLILDAAEKAGSTDPADVRAALEGMKYDGVTGPEEVRAFDHQVIKNYYLLQGKAASEMRGEDDFADIISTGKSFLSAENTACSLA